jgi:hypothetical protein
MNKQLEVYFEDLSPGKQKQVLEFYKFPTDQSWDKDSFQVVYKGLRFKITIEELEK